MRKIPVKHIEIQTESTFVGKGGILQDLSVKVDRDLQLSKTEIVMLQQLQASVINSPLLKGQSNKSLLKKLSNENNFMVGFPEMVD